MYIHKSRVNNGRRLKIKEEILKFLGLKKIILILLFLKKIIINIIFFAQTSVHHKKLHLYLCCTFQQQKHCRREFKKCLLAFHMLSWLQYSALHAILLQSSKKVLFCNTHSHRHSLAKWIILAFSFCRERETKKFMGNCFDLSETTFTRK